MRKIDAVIESEIEECEAAQAVYEKAILKYNRYCYRFNQTVQRIGHSKAESRLNQLEGESESAYWAWMDVIRSQGAKMKHFVLTFDDGSSIVLNRNEMAKEFKGSNLFDADSWECGSRQLSTLDQVLAVIKPGEAWTCDNCTVSVA